MKKIKSLFAFHRPSMHVTITDKYLEAFILLTGLCSVEASAYLFMFHLSNNFYGQICRRTQMH